MIALGAIQAGSQIYSGWKQKEAAEENAKLMREQASFQRDQYDDQASTMQTQSNAVLGGQRNAMARSGVKTDQGSPLSLLRANEKALNKDIGRTRQAGQHAYDTGMNQANSLEQQGQDAFTASLIGGATSFAGTLANNVNIPRSSSNTSSLSGQQATAINNSDINYADFKPFEDTMPINATQYGIGYKGQDKYNWKKNSIWGMDQWQK